MRKVAVAVVLVLFAAGRAGAELRHEAVAYEHGGVKLEGYVVWDDAIEGKRPGVLVVHEWWGLDEYARTRADQLAGLGYVAFAADMYGKGKLTEHPRQAQEWAGQVRANVESWRERAGVALNLLRRHEQVDAERLAAIGYCFGGATVLQLAFSGEDLDAVVSFHGALPVPSPQDVGRVKASILVCHGAEDAFIPDETVRQFRDALDAEDVDWLMVSYGQAKHSFTVPGASEEKLRGTAYNRAADERSWRHMRELFEEKLGK